MTYLSPLNTTAPITNRAAVMDTIANEVSEATRRAYLQAMKLASTFYEERGWTFYPSDEEGNLNAQLFVEQVLSYLQTLQEDGKSPSTVVKTLSALKHFAAYDNDRAFSLLLSKPVRAWMEGFSRASKGYSPKKAQALQTSQMLAIYKALEDRHSIRSIRDKALIALGIATALRSSSIAELQLADVTPAISIDGKNIHVRFSKTDQKGKGHYIPVKSAKGPLDPIAALEEWLDCLSAFGVTRETHPNHPLFPTIIKEQGLTAKPMLHPNMVITDTIRRCLVEVELMNAQSALAYSSHSLRSTFVTLSSLAGVSEKDIALVSGHKDMNTLRSYDRTSAERSAQTEYLTVTS